MPFRPPIPAAPPDPATAALEVADADVQAAEVAAREAGERLAEARATHQRLAREQAAAEEARRAKEARLDLADRLQPLGQRVAELDNGIAEAAGWLRDGVEERQRLADLARRIATRGLTVAVPAGVVLPPALQLPTLRAPAERRASVTLEIQYSLGPVPTEVS